jgi:hypothetical protein
MELKLENYSQMKSDNQKFLMLKDSRTYWEKTLTWVKVSFWFSLKQYMTHKSFVKSLLNIRDQTGRVSMWFLINFRPNIAYTDKLPLNPCWVLVIFSNNWPELVYTISILSFVCCHSSFEFSLHSCNMV